MGVVNTTYTFTATDTITSTKMNNIIDDTVMTASAISGTTLEVTGSGQLKVRAASITSNELAANAVTETAIASGSVTSSKIESTGPQWGSNYTVIGNTTNQNPYYFTIGQNRTADGANQLNFITSSPGSSANASITRNSGVNGNFVINNTGTGNLAFENAGGSIFFSGPNGITFYKDASNTSNFPVPAGTAPIFGARAWVNFNGTSGSTAIRDGGNVSSVTRDSTGKYTIAFTTAMPDTNYAIFGFARDADNSGNNYFVSASQTGTKTTSQVQIDVNSPGGTVDSPEVNLMIIR